MQAQDYDDRPGIEITPEMVEAGVEVLRDYHWGDDNADEFAIKIWQAMEMVSALTRS